ncbi:MAG TPA: asparagine synthetase B [Fibrobacteria bacterium]|jgi:hypothetical protein|nr:asparagine synthetase B [Fibrobacteria bacterium]
MRRSLRFPRLSGALGALLWAMVLLPSSAPQAARLLIPMDQTQLNHLKAYGVAHFSLSAGHKVEWLLNYRGGSFLLDDTEALQRESARRGVLFERLDDGAVARLRHTIEHSEMEAVMLEKAPRMAVYTLPTTQPWDDAVTLALTYAEIPYDRIYDREIIGGKLSQYDWLHLHHEDFTGQYSRFHRSFSNAPWYRTQVATQEALAHELGFVHNVALKRAVALTIRAYVENGGFLLAMCLATASLDMALAAAATDVADAVYDGTPVAPDHTTKINYDLALAFTGFSYHTDPMSPSHGDLDYNQVNTGALARRPAHDFTLFGFSPKFDPVPSMLTQSHTDVIPGFLGLTTSFTKSMVKPSITILGEAIDQPAVRYLHGNLGRGQFTYYGGHDPEDYAHAVGDAPTDLDLHRSSPGYRLILNNVLYPAARQKKRKT